MLSSGKLVCLVAILLWLSVFVVGQPGSWQLLQSNAGISSMHSAVTHFDQLILLDRTNIGPSKILLPDGRCREQPVEKKSTSDCYAHSVMLDPSYGSVRPLFIYTDTWCSSGAFFDNGVMVQTGGDYEGNKVVRTLTPCGLGGNCDWVETGDRLSVGRWYASNQLLPSGKQQIVVGGRDGPNYEFYPKRTVNEGSFYVPMLRADLGQDTLYPFVVLLPNGDVFFFAGKSSVQINWSAQRTVRTFPVLPGPSRNYPSAGSSALLPLTWETEFTEAEIMVCGGAQEGASKKGLIDAPADASCGRMVITAKEPAWEMSEMPIRRTMGDMINLPNGEVLIINGAQNGYQGWGKANNPALNPVSYNPTSKSFAIWAKTDIPRMYHCTANLLSDGRVLVAGSNTHQFYTYTGEFPTELRVEAFSPPYMAGSYKRVHPIIIDFQRQIKYNEVFTVTYFGRRKAGPVDCVMNSSPFSTHSYSQGQRQVRLKTTPPAKVRKLGLFVQCTAVSSANVLPPSYYMLFLVQRGIPSRGVWVQQIN